MRFHQVICFWWDSDLVEAIESEYPGPVASLQCVLPPWQSLQGCWETRDIASVWRVPQTDPAGPSIFIFRDRDGHEVRQYGNPVTIAEADRELVWQPRRRTRRRTRARADGGPR